MADTALLELLTFDFEGEHVVLKGLLYKNKNQHCRANFYQKLQEVQRYIRRLDTAELAIHLRPTK